MILCHNSHYHPSTFQQHFSASQMPQAASSGITEWPSELKHWWPWGWTFSSMLRKRQLSLWAEPWCHWSRTGGNPFLYFAFFVLYAQVICFHICCFLCLEQTCSVSLWHSVNQNERLCMNWERETFSLGLLYEAAEPGAEVVTAGGRGRHPESYSSPNPRCSQSCFQEGRLSLWKTS